jgi:hypothetical protein
MSLAYTVYVDDNFHYQDEEHRYMAGEFASHEEAVAECKSIVADYLMSALEPGMTASALYSSYTMFGEDPFVVGPHGAGFSAWTYAKQRCQDLCGDA